MAKVVTINRPDVVALIEKAAKQITGGNKTELMATAVRCLLEQKISAEAVVRCASWLGPCPQGRGSHAAGSRRRDGRGDRPRDRSVTDLLLDTHVLVWLDNGDRKLGEPSRRAIEQARREGGRIFSSCP